MKISLPAVTDFIGFQHPLRDDIIEARFMSVHKDYASKSRHWSLAATRKKLIAGFWCREVNFHFMTIIGTATLLCFPFAHNKPLFLFSALIAALLSFVVLVMVSYYPSYYSVFLPVLDNVIAEQERAAALVEETKKCRRTQFSGPTLIIIYYTLFKMGAIPLLSCNDGYAGLLNNLFGVDRGMLKQNLSRLHKLGSLSVKEKAEFRKGMDHARTFFEQAGGGKALVVIGELEQKLLQG